MRLLDRAGNRQKLLSAAARFAVAVLCVSSFAQRVLAQPVAAPRLQYEATGACPTQAEFLMRMRTRMDADGTRAPGDISLRVMLSAQAVGTHGTIEIRRGATNTRRIVDGGRCEEVAEALALIAALAVREADSARDPRPRTRARKPDKTTSPPNPDPTKTTNNEATTTRSESKRAAEPTPTPENSITEAAGSRRGGASSERSTIEQNGGADEQSTGVSAARDAAAESGSDAQPSTDGASAKAARSQELASSASWRVGASAMLFSGLAPELQPALQLQAAVTLNEGALEWSLQLGARIARSTALASPDGDARFGFAGGIVRLCAAHALGPTPLTLTGCAAAEPGVFSAKGENTRNQRTHSRLWLAAGVAADLSVQLASWLSLTAGAELLAPLRRDRIVLAGDTLYRVPALGFRWHLGLEVPFG